MSKSIEPTRLSKSELRHRQVLSAAADCFRRCGFHGASIAQISKQAGMSPGHIYHFFENKEAIIAAIVEQRVNHALELVARFDAQPDVFGTLIENVDLGIKEKTDPDFVGLWLEVLAEAARNPNVARIVYEADSKLRQRIKWLEARAHESRGVDTQVDPDAATEVIMALFEGLGNRIVQNPHMDMTEIEKVMRIALQGILEA
ncbi:MAG: TetR/AcrR family transcriptional regulator [Gammaproteobacteria bacterium]|nr:TetR/AcrR family transcriptional regulator [Gammaproteobacteria bacterium]